MNKAPNKLKTPNIYHNTLKGGGRPKYFGFRNLKAVRNPATVRTFTAEEIAAINATLVN